MSGQPERPVETVQEWLRYAEEDLGVAAREFERGSIAYHTMCFLCQAAAEKLLKAYLIAHGWMLERTHVWSRCWSCARRMTPTGVT